MNLKSSLLYVLIFHRSFPFRVSYEEILLKMEEEEKEAKSTKRLTTDDKSNFVQHT